MLKLGNGVFMFRRSGDKKSSIKQGYQTLVFKPFYKTLVSGCHQSKRTYKSIDIA